MTKTLAEGEAVAASAPAPWSAPAGPAATEAAVLRGVARTWPGGVTALAGADLELPRGAAVAVAGPNGSGKSTLLALLAGRLAPSAGGLTVLGLDPARRRGRRALRRRVGYLRQEVALDPEMTGAETLALLAALHGVPWRRRRAQAAALAAAWGLDEYLRRRVETYSGGLKRRLHLAGGEVHEPELLLLDEPTAGLDPAGRELVWRRVAAHRKRGATVVVATHDLDAAGRRCDLVVILERGRVLAFASPASLLVAHAAPDLTAVYTALTGAPPEPSGQGGRAGKKRESPR
jgi:ABC-type multidrug transport system ATPase subunit